MLRAEAVDFTATLGYDKLELGQKPARGDLRCLIKKR